MLLRVDCLVLGCYCVLVLFVCRGCCWLWLLVVACCRLRCLLCLSRYCVFLFGVRVVVCCVMLMMLCVCCVTFVVVDCCLLFVGRCLLLSLFVYCLFSFCGALL